MRRHRYWSSTHHSKPAWTKEPVLTYTDEYDTHTHTHTHTAGFGMYSMRISIDQDIPDLFLIAWHRCTNPQCTNKVPRLDCTKYHPLSLSLSPPPSTFNSLGGGSRRALLLLLPPLLLWLCPVRAGASVCVCDGSSWIKVVKRSAKKECSN